MTLTTVITVGLGLILVYYLLGLIVNILTQIVKDVLELRAKSLEKMLKDLLEAPDGAPDGDETKGIEAYEALMAQPLIQSLKPLYGHFLRKADRKIPKIPSQTFSLALLSYLGDVKASNEFLMTSAHRIVGEILEKIRPEAGNDSESEPDPMAAALSDKLEALLDEKDIDTLLLELEQILAQIKLLRSGDDGAWVEAVESLEQLVEFIRASPEMQLEAIRAGISKLPEGSKARGALTSLIDFSVKDIEDARTRIEKWYDDSMANASGLFKRYTRQWVVILSLLVTVVFGGDTIAIAQTLAQQPIDVSDVVAIVESVESVDPNQLSQEQQDQLEQRFEDLGTVVDTLSELRLPIPWWQDGFSSDPAENLLMALGLLITWAFVSQGSSFWYDILKLVKGSSGGSSSAGKEASGTASGQGNK